MRTGKRARVLPRITLALVLGALITSCGPATEGVPDGAPLGACSVGIGATMYCHEILAYRGSPGTFSLERECAAQGGTYLTACPATNRAGRCTMDIGPSRQVLNYYRPAPPALVRSLCDEAHGTFTPE